MSEQEKITKLEKKISKEMYGIDKADDFSKDLDKITDAINRISLGNKKFTGDNLLEYLNRVEFGKKNDMSQAKKRRPVNNSDIENVLSKENINQLINFEKDRISRYNDYNLIYSYITQLAACVDVYRDCIMSPDDLTKSSLNVYYKNTITSEKNSDVINNLNFLTKKYKLNGKAKQIITKTLINGDYYVAVLKYDDEFNKMLLNEDNDNLFIDEKEKASKYLLHENQIEESDVQLLAEILNEADGNEKDKEKPKDTDVYAKIKKELLDSINDNVNFIDDPKKSLMKVNNKNISKLNKDMSKKNSDGFVEFGMKGSIVKMLEPEHVIKLEVDGINFGYIYIEKTDEFVNNKRSSINDFFDSRVDIEREKFKDREQIITGIFAKGISKKIDNDLVKDNKEFKDYLYVLLKEKYITDKKVNITYLAPDEVVDFALDRDGLYGQSMLSRSLFFAKLYLATLITELMQKISRGRDKRIIYVETGLDDDVEGVVQGIVKDIKSKEIQTDVLKSITTILNNIGAFDDYYVPLVDGEKPIDFDTLQGMDVDADNDFLQFLLKSAINGTKVPVNYIDASNEVDFARTLAMQNSTFVRSIVVDQGDFSESFSQLYRILYRNEFLTQERKTLDDINREKKDKDNKKPIKKEDDKKKKDADKKDKDDSDTVDLNYISVLFPVPIALNLNNINDQISNTSQSIDFHTSLYVDDQDMSNTEMNNKVKLAFKRKLARKLLPNIADWDEMDKLFEEAQMEAMEQDIKNPQPSMDMGDGGEGGGLGDMGGGQGGDDF